jgi:hypothetical protein
MYSGKKSKIKILDFKSWRMNAPEMSVSSELVTCLVFATANWIWRDLFGTVLTTATNITLKTTKVFDLYFIHMIWSMYIELVNITEVIQWLRKGLYLLCASQLVYCRCEALFSPCNKALGDGRGRKAEWLKSEHLYILMRQDARFYETSAHNTSNCAASL